MATSEPDSIGTDVFIGEVATFHLQFIAPQGTVAQMSFTDSLPTGLAYVAGSARLARIFDTNLTASANPGGINAATSGTFVNLTDGSEVLLSGQNVVVTLGDVTNTDADADTESYIFELKAVVQNIATNQAGGGFINQGRLDFLDSASQAQYLTASGPPMLRREAQLAVVKTVSPVDLNADVGGTVHFTIAVTNTAGFYSAPAYDIEIFDSLPSGLQDLTNVVISSSGAVGINDQSTLNKAEVVIDALAVGGQITVEFDATAPPPVPSTIVNAVRTTWSSLPGSFGTNGQTPGSPGTTLGERNTTNGYKVNAKATISAVGELTPTRTRQATNTPLSGGPTPTRTPTIAPGSTATYTPSGPSPTPSATIDVGSMGVRFVSVGRVNPGSEILYTVALVVYSRGTVTDVRAQLTLPPEVEFLNANLPPTSAPPVGGTGLVYWNLGNLTGPANSPLEVQARVRNDFPFDTYMTAFLHIENGQGEVFDLTRSSRIGRTDRARLSRERKETFITGMNAVKRVQPGGVMVYRLKASSFLREGFASLVVRAVLPAGVLLGTIEPAPALIDALPGGDSIIEWRFSNPGRSVRAKIYANASASVVPGQMLEAFVTVSDEHAEKSLILATTVVP